MNVGFIGNGVMAQALMKGMLDKHVIQPSQIYVYDIYTEGLLKSGETYGVHTVGSNIELVRACEVLILAVKPYVCASVLEEIKPFLTEDKIIASIAAGWSTQKLRDAVEGKAKILKVMPNTPAMVGEGVIIFSKDSDCDDKEIEALRELFSANGLVVMLDDNKMYATSSVSGTIPAMVAMLIEALSDAGVINGLPRKTALDMAAQAVMGSAKWVLESPEHPGELKDKVCTPAGVTIEVVRSLENDGFRGTVMRAADAGAKKNYDMMYHK